MNSERHIILQALTELNTHVNIEDIIAKSGLTRGKILGNLPRLCIDGLVDKCGRLYAISKIGRIVIAELTTIPENKCFRFYLAENEYTKQIACNLKEFSEIIEIIDHESLEFHIQRGDFENWIRKTLHYEELANEIAELRRNCVSGEALREKLCASVKHNYKILDTLITSLSS